MNKERVAWFCFTSLALIGQYCYHIVDSKRQPMVSATSVSDADLLEQLNSLDWPKTEITLIPDLIVPPDLDEEIQYSSEPASDVDDIYSKGYTDGYHRALEQVYCPSKSH